LEIGRGKETQSADFSLLTSIPTFSIDIKDRQPFRCDGCGRWIIYCKKVIDDYSNNGVPANHNHEIKCVNCPYFNEGNCPDIIYYGQATNRYGDTRTARYHFRCIDQTLRTQILSNVNQHQDDLVAYYPLVEGLENFNEEKL